MQSSSVERNSFAHSRKVEPNSKNPSPENASHRREPIKQLLIGSPKTVSSTIHYLQVIGYVSIGDWSPLLPTTNPGEVISILVRQILMK
ncbi:MAG: hypothetical protein EA343_21625 [Nodularia sp. (in: Bacteria)]|nr:MAG: hypothetical protein EA343_21625 [Nodularia sp. (in: cyanobacteria)]